MKHILKYYFSLGLTLSLFLVQAQDTIPTTTNRIKVTGEVPEQTVKKTPEKTPTSSTPAKTDRYGVRVGVDLYKLTRGLYDDNYKGIELVGDYRLAKRFFLATELGSEEKTTEDAQLNTTTKGTYIKAGFDYNVYDNWLNMENIISIGLRGGFSTFSQELNTYTIYNRYPYWGEMPPIESGKEFDGLTAGWIEVVAGIKAQVIKNVFMGFSVRLNTLIYDNKPSDNFENLYIPGFNRTYDGNFGVGFNYTVSYFIPLYKKEEKQKKK